MFGIFSLTESSADHSSTGDSGAALSPAAIYDNELREFKIQENKLRFRNTKINLNIIFVIVNGSIVAGYIALAHNLGEPASDCKYHGVNCVYQCCG